MDAQPVENLVGIYLTDAFVLVYRPNVNVPVQISKFLEYYVKTTSLFFSPQQLHPDFLWYHVLELTHPLTR